MSKGNNLTVSGKSRIRVMPAKKTSDGQPGYSHAVIAESEKLNESQKRRIIREVSKEPFCSSGDQVKILDLDVKAKAVAKVLKTQGVTYGKLKTAPRMTAQHKSGRAAFAVPHLEANTDFNSWLWSDEKRFNLDGPDCIYYTWNFSANVRWD